MKKILYSFSAFLLFLSTANAAIVVTNTAQAVAAGFYAQSTQKQVADITLAYTETSSTGEAVYYVFNVNGTEGFVIVSAEDAGRPIIGYSTQGNYIVPSATSNYELNFWMQTRKTEIEGMRADKLTADSKIAKEWSTYATNKIYYPATMSTPHAPLVQSHWNQNGGGSVPYNNLCPGGSVTGCVATTMGQIMRFWSYPSSGTGSHSYNAGSYGTLSATFSKTYNWANMPLNSSNSSVAQISYDCGVSVNMNYSPSGSGAQVCGSPAAEYSYKTYFKYDPTLHCVYFSSYTLSAWNALLVAEFAAGRPVQYVGVDPTAGGHTWVADGNDASDKIHMNWGWAGSGDGYFDVTNLAVAGDNFSNSMTALIGIKPQTPTTALDAGMYSLTAPAGTSCNSSFTPALEIKNFGSSTITSCKISYYLDANTPQTYTWNGSLTSFQTTTVTLTAITVPVGSHIFYCSTTQPNGGTDGNTANDQMQSMVNVISSTASKVGSYSEGFEASGFPYADAYVYSASGAQWAPVSGASTSGTSSLKIANFGNVNGDGDEFITPSIDMTNITNATMTFQVAHAQLATTDADQLQILTSSNCGGSWVQRYSKFGSALTTAGTSSSAFTPSSASQWRQETVNISSVAGMPDVRVKFKFNSNGAGNNTFIDDININTTGAGVAEELANGFNLSIYPNPMVDQTTINFTLQDKYNVAVGVYDIVGKQVLSVTNASELSAGMYTLPLSKNTLSKGVYFVKLDVNGYSVSKKVIVQ